MFHVEYLLAWARVPSYVLLSLHKIYDDPGEINPTRHEEDKYPTDQSHTLHKVQQFRSREPKSAVHGGNSWARATAATTETVRSGALMQLWGVLPSSLVFHFFTRAHLVFGHSPTQQGYHPKFGRGQHSVLLSSISLVRVQCHTHASAGLGGKYRSYGARSP